MLLTIERGDAQSGGATFTNGGNGSSNGIIDTQSAVGGWPVYSASEEELTKVTDSDEDGIPDYYEDLFSLNKNDASDGLAFTLDPKKRYSNLEMYLHWLVKDIVKEQNNNGTYSKH